MAAGWRPAMLVLALCLALLPAKAAEISVGAVQIERFRNAGIGERVGRLIWRGGLVMTSQEDTFGGLSGVGFVSDQQHLVFVTDRGNFVSGQLVYDDLSRPLGLVGVRIEPIRNSSGDPLPRQFARDAEALAVVHRDGAAVAVRVGFENLTRVADFALTDHRPGGAAREVAIPDWLTNARTNRALESVCIAPPASPVAGSTLLLTEGVLDAAGNRRAWLLGNRDRGALSYRARGGVDPTDCAFLPNGDLLVLERGVSLLGFTMVLRRVPADAVRPGAIMDGEVLLAVSGSEIDNMEGLAVHVAPDGETRIAIVSDGNFSDWQRNLLLEFALAE